MERQVKTKLDEMEVQLRNDIQVELQSEFDRQMNTAKEEIITKMKQDFNSEKKLMKTELESKIDTKIQTEKPEVLFYAFRNTGTTYLKLKYFKPFFTYGFCAGGTIGSGSLTFDRAPINIGGSMKPLRGEFEAPVRGIYYFSFSSMTSDQVEGTTGVYIYKNGAQFNVIYESHGNKKYNNLNSSWMMKLERGDQVKMKILQGKLFANVNIHLLWTGHLLKADV